MPDSKITALASIGTGTDPAVDPLVIVDVSDTSMAASGTTKKVTLNQLLATSPTATLASATITGDLTVDTNVLKVDSANNRVGIGTASPRQTLEVVGGTAGINTIFNTGSAGDSRFELQNNSVRAGYVYWDTSEVRLFADSGRALNFYPNGTLGMTLNSTGLGVGVASPTNKLDVNGNASFTGFGINANPQNPVSTTQRYTRLQNTGGDFYAGIESSVAGAFFPNSTAYAACLYNAANVPMHFYTNSALRMTLDVSGNLLVGTTTNTNSSRVFIRGTGGAAGLAIQSATGDLAQPGLLVGKFDNDSTTSQILVRFTINNNASGSGQINANGANQAAFGSFSDSRLKENIVSLPSQLSNILSLRPVEFDYKDGSGHQIGFVAQEMQEVYSDAVGEQNGFLTVTGWSKTEARLVSAIKELAAKVQALEAKLA